MTLSRHPGATAALVLLSLFFIPQPAFAAEIDSGDTAFVLISSALVLFMTPGLAFFYGGLVRRKNVLSTMMHSFAMMGVVSVQWVLIGYTLAFGPDVGHFIGGLDHLGLQGVGLVPDEGSTIPPLLFMVFQGMFAIITPALISGAYAERMKFSAMLIFSLLWSTLVYAPLAHWVWGGGWLHSMGALDFAGGTVVHISSAISAGAALLFVGRRRGFPQEAILPHNLTHTVLGVGILWFGWFGFNAGSALAANGTAVLAFVTTNVAAGAGALGWMFTDWIRHGKPTVLGLVSGALGGLVGITPACGFVSPLGAIAIGAIAGVACNYAVHFRMRLKLDDSLDVLGVHGVGGTLGAILTGVFALPEFLVHGEEVYTRGYQIWVQFVSVIATYGFGFVMSLAIFFVADKLVGVRVDAEDEVQGLDLSQHGERAYDGV